MTEFMRSSDAFTWAMESDPRLRSTVVTVLLLEKSPDWDDVRERIDLMTRKLPMFRQRVVESPVPTPPRWKNDPDFDLDFHIRGIAAPEPGNLGGVLEIARVAGMEDFDRARPLWTVTLIDGLEDGGAAVLCKFHHSLTDGVGGVQIGMTLFDLSELPSEHERLAQAPKVTKPSWLSGYRIVSATTRDSSQRRWREPSRRPRDCFTTASDTRRRPSNPQRPLRLRSTELSDP